MMTMIQRCLVLHPLLHPVNPCPWFPRYSTALQKMSPPITNDFLLVLSYPAFASYTFNSDSLSMSGH